MRIHCLQHVAYEDEAYISQWVKNNGLRITRTRLYDNEEPPHLADFDCLLIMGGPMSIHDEFEHKWLVEEKRFIEKALADNKIVIGICLGAQLIANVLGARVYSNKFKEIGWFPVVGVGDRGDTILGEIFKDDFMAFHWHGDTFDLPSGAVHIVKSEACENQAFEINKRIFGFQFHMESTVASIEMILGSVKGKLPVSQYIQSEEVIRGNYKNVPLINDRMKHFLDLVLADYKALCS